ncbi:MAG: hypothetical protein PHT71_06070 [Victivallaceae bacterium]|nr:hypothetical protein [Victivallaceae bacterium]
MNCGSLSWSWSRDRLFSFCPRAYWLYYHGAGGGWSALAEPELQQIYRLKKMIPGNWWLDQLFSEALRSTLPFSGKGFAAAVSKLFDRGCGQIRRRDWLQDPGTLNIAEIYYSEIEPELFLKNSRRELRRRLEVLESSPLPQILTQIGEIDRCLLQYPCEIAVGAVTAWCNPVIAWHDQGQLLFLNQLNPDSERFSATLQCVLAMQKFQIPPSRVGFVGYNYETGEFREFSAKALEISITLADIEKRAFSLNPVAFMPNHENCPSCRFRQYCADIPEDQHPIYSA